MRRVSEVSTAAAGAGRRAARPRQHSARSGQARPKEDEQEPGSPGRSCAREHVGERVVRLRGPRMFVMLKTLKHSTMASTRVRVESQRPRARRSGVEPSLNARLRTPAARVHRAVAADDRESARSAAGEVLLVPEPQGPYRPPARPFPRSVPTPAAGGTVFQVVTGHRVPPRSRARPSRARQDAQSADSQEWLYRATTPATHFESL